MSALHDDNNNICNVINNNNYDCYTSFYAHFHIYCYRYHHLHDLYFNKGNVSANSFLMQVHFS